MNERRWKSHWGQKHKYVEDLSHDEAEDEDDSSTGDDEAENDRKAQVVAAANLPQQQRWVLESAAAIPARIAGSVVQMDLDYRATYDGQKSAKRQQTETNRYV